MTSTHISVDCGLTLAAEELTPGVSIRDSIFDVVDTGYRFVCVPMLRNKRCAKSSPHSDELSLSLADLCLSNDLHLSSEGKFNRIMLFPRKQSLTLPQNGIDLLWPSFMLTTLIPPTKACACSVRKFVWIRFFDTAASYVSQCFTQEFNWGLHLGLSALLLPRIKERLANYASLVSRLLASSMRMQCWLRVPMVASHLQ